MKEKVEEGEVEEEWETWYVQKESDREQISSIVSGRWPASTIFRERRRRWRRERKRWSRGRRKRGRRKRKMRRRRKMVKSKEERGHGGTDRLVLLTRLQVNSHNIILAR